MSYPAALTAFKASFEGAERIEVAFGDQLSAPADIVGYDARNDVAVLKVNLPPAALEPTAKHPRTTGSSLSRVIYRLVGSPP